MSKIKQVLLLSSMQQTILLLLCAFLMPIEGWSASYPVNRDYGSQGDFIAKRGTEFGRTADLTPIGPVLINLPEAPGSTSNGVEWRFETTAWDLSDLTNPQLIRSLTCPTCFSGQPMSAHGTIIRLDKERNEAQLFAVDPQFVVYDPNGIDSNAQVLGVDRTPDNYVGGMLAPYATAGFWEYGFQPGPLWIREPRTPFTPSPEFPTDRGAPWLGAFVAEWDHLGLTSVTGFTAFLGELLIVASDQQSTGIAIYDRSGLKDGETPRLISQFRPNLTEPDGSPISVGGYWMEPYGANKIVWAARPRDIAPARDYPAMYVVDFTDPTNPQLTCEIYFDLDRNDPSDGDGSSDPMYVNFQDQYAFVDHFKVDIDACEQAYAGDQNIDAVELAQISYKFDDIANHCDGSQYFRPLGQVGVFGGYDWWVTDSIISYTGGTMTNWQWHSRPDGAGFNPVVTLGAGRAMVSPAIRNGETVNIQVGDVFTNGFTEQQYTVTNVERDARINEQGMCFMVTSDVADTRAPFVSGHRPLANQVDVPVDTYIHIHIPETLRSETLVNATRVIRVDDNGNEIESVTFESQFSHTGTLSIWPNSDLVVDASYRVELTGVQDYMGNTMEDYSFVFSTGDTVIAPPPPDTTPPPTYAGPTYYPNQSSEMSCLAESQENNIWVVNPDNDSVTIIDTNHDAESFLLSEEVVNEIDLGYKQPTSVTHIEGVYAITYRGDDKVAFLSSNGVEQFSVDTGYGSQPIASITDGQFLYVSLYGSGEVLKLDIANQNIVSRLVVGEKPKAMALREERLLVTRFISAPDHGEVYDIDTSGDMSLSRTIRVNKVGVADDLDHGSGVPNMLSSIVISPDGETAYITAIKANVDRGLFRNGVPLDSDNTVRPMLAILDLVQNRDANVDTSTREGTLDFDNAADPSFITYLADGEHRVTSLRGNNVVLVQNNILNTSAQFNTGFAPRSACATLRTLYVKNFTDRSISAIDVAPYMHDGTRSSRTLTINTVANEILSAEEKQGLRVFYHSSQPEMGDEGYMTCASCHTDGGQDGMTWDLTSLGEGMRNTLSLNGTQGTRFGDLHWSGNFDEVQDFELQIEQLNGGDGLIEGRTFNGQSPLDFESANRSADLDALAAYVSSLGKDSLQRSPYRTTAGGLTDAAQQGQQLFQQQGCASCHQGAAFRDGQRHDVGTLTEASGSRLTGLLTDIRTPTLVELWDSAPYFHDGSAATLEDVLSRGTHQVSINQSDRNDLIEFLLSIDSSVFIDDDAQWPDLPINRSPTVINPIADQMTVVGQPYEFVIPQNVFNDVDGGTLTIRAGSLMPSWLSFNSDLLVLSGTPAQVGSVEIEVVADDGQGGSVSDFFILNITANSSLDAVDDTVVGELLDDGRIRILISDLLANDSPGQGGLQIPYLDDWINGVAQLNSQVGEEIIFIPEGVENGQFTYALEDSSGAIDWAIVTVLVNAQPEDTEPPVITIDGYASGSTINLTVGDAFSIPSATATDNVDGAVSVTTSGSADVNQVGTYPINFTAVDSAANSANAILTVVVRAANSPLDAVDDAVAGELLDDGRIRILISDLLANDSPGQGGLQIPYLDDWINGVAQLNSQVGEEIIFIPEGVENGQFTYALEDSSGAIDWAIVTVLVNAQPEDTEPPVITIDGYASGSTINLTVGDAFSIPSATATDNVDGAVSVTTSGSVDVNQAGSYTISYSATDAAGNTAQSQLIVIVSPPADTEPPVITINGYEPDDTINLIVDEAFSVPLATAIDAEDGAVLVTTSGSVDVSQVGSYIITYAAVDAAGNSANASLTVIVRMADSPLDAVNDVVSGEVLDDGRIRILISELLANDSLGQGGASIPYLDDWINGVAQLNSAAEEILFTPSGSQNGQFTYALIDSSDAVDWAIVTVVVNSQPSDTVPPVISINGYASGDTINLTVGDTFSIPSATAIDNVDGAVSVTTSGSVDVNQTGSYVITYSASDAAGNTTNSIVTVRVNEANPSLGYLALSDTERAVYPVFSANGEFTLTGRLRITEATANQNSFTSSSTGDYIAYQGHNGRVRAHILGTNFTVNTGQLAEGAFIDFSLSRDAGNNVRLVVNGASTGFKRSGMLTFDGFNGTNHFFAATFDNGATDQRNYDFNVPENATLILDTIGGENATVIRDGEPQTDTEPPVISIEGYLSGDTINLTVGDTFSIPTATAIDNVDGAVSVTTSGSVDVNQAGSYAITYSATDVAGNIASANLSFIVTEDVTNPPNTPPNAVNRVRQFTFNHSLWQHNFDNNAVTGYWVGDFANASGTTYAWSGQFGQLDYHDLPPSPSLGSTNTLPLWDNEDTNAPNYQATFEGVDLDNIIIMPNNFEQAGTSIVTEAYFSDALRVIDDVAIRQPDAPIVIYEHWPELNNASYPPTPEQESAYHLAQLGNAHQWFVNYQNEIAQRRPDANIRMIPVGPILSEIFTNPIFQASEMSWEERYDDNAPHGTPSLYFLAGLITYQAMFGQPVVDSYVAPSQIDVRIRNQFSTLNDFIWQRLNFYNANGVRVWSEGADNIVPTVEVSDNAALIAAINEMTDGGIIALQPGTYNCFQINERDYSAASPLVIQGNSSDNSQVIVEGRSASGSRCTNAVRVDNSSYVAFRNFSIQDGLDGMLISTSEHVIVDNLAISLSDQAGIVVNKNSADVDIVNSRIFNTGNQNPQYGECIYIGTGGSQGFPDETVRVWIEGNDISNCGFAEAINIKPEVFDSTVRNNRISDISPGNPLWSQYNQAAITVEGGRGSNPDNNHRPQDERNVWLENNTITNVTYSNPDDTRANPVNGSSKRSFANGIMVGATGVHIVGNTISNYEENGILLNNYGNLGLPTYRFGNVIAEPTVARDPNPAFPNREIFTAIRNSTIVTSQQAANTLTRQTWLP